jgi:hypothetical protein
MLQNVGNIDRIIRVVVGLLVLSLVMLGPQTAWGFLGLIPLASGIFGYCPVYHLLGLNTCSAHPRTPQTPRTPHAGPA